MIPFSVAQGPRGWVWVASMVTAWAYSCATREKIRAGKAMTNVASAEESRFVVPRVGGSGRPKHRVSKGVKLMARAPSRNAASA